MLKYFGPHCWVQHNMRPIVTIVAWCVCLSVCLSVGHEHELCQNGWTDRDALSVDLWEPKEPCFGWGLRSPHRKGHFWGSYMGMPRLACSRYSQLYSLGGGGDAASSYQSTVTTCLLMQWEVQAVFDGDSQSACYKPGSRRAGLQRPDCHTHIAHCRNCRHVLFSDWQCRSVKTFRGRPRRFAVFCHIIVCL